MGRQYQVNGETLVKLKGGTHLQNFGMSGSAVVTLGVAADPITISYNLNHLDIHTDKYTQEKPVDVMWMGADAIIKMNLIHWDNDILNTAVSEAMDGYDPDALVSGGTGIPGLTLGHNLDPYSSGCRYMGLGLTSTVTSGRSFPTCYLHQQPIQMPLSTEKSIVQVTFRAIRYSKMNSDGTVAEPSLLWEYTNL